jgi:uncharacterized low-complexity protein
LIDETQVEANDRKTGTTPLHKQNRMEISMSQKNTLKPLAIAIGATLATSLAAIAPASATENPFAMSELSSGYLVAEMAEGKCGAGMKMDKEGKCGAAKATESTTAMKEGKCGMKMMDANGDGSVTKEEFMQGHDAMFGKLDANGDGVIDADEQSAGMKMMKEGKCGEGKCGGAMATDKAKTMQ